MDDDLLDFDKMCEEAEDWMLQKLTKDVTTNRLWDIFNRADSDKSGSVQHTLCFLYLDEDASRAQAH